MRVCIVGTGRSGTTLVQKMMGLHPDLYIFPETHWIPKLFEFFGMDEAPTEALMDVVQRTMHVTGTPVTEFDEHRFQEVTQGASNMTVRAFCDVIGRLFAEEHSKRYWADKTPDYGYCMTTIQLLWPECRFIHSIRHGVEVVESMSKHAGYKAVAAAGEANWGALAMDYHGEPISTGELPLDRFVKLWCSRLARTRDESTRLRAESYVETRLEELLRDPDTVLSELASFAGLDAPQSWLDAAKELIDPNRGQVDKDREISALFGEREIRLLHEFGYALKDESR